MKASFFCTNTYLAPEAFARPGWPAAPKLYQPEIGSRSADYALEQARLADEAGFDWISCSEHHYMPLLQTPNPNVFAAALTQVVKRARIAVLGPLVSMTNPVRVAEELAMLDQLSKGRLVMLFLRGTPNEFLAYGVNPDETRARTQEASALIVRALTEPEPFAWEGRFFRFRTIAVWPGPIQRPHPPTYYSGNSFESASFAAANHFGLGMSYYPLPMVSKLASYYRDQCAKSGWQPETDQLIYRTFVGVAEDDKTAAGMKERFFGLTATVASMNAGRGAAVKALTPFGAAESFSRDRERKGAPIPDQGQAGFGFGALQFCGAPDAVVQQIADFHAQTGIGVLDVSFGGAGLTPEEAERSFRLFSREVLPRIRRISGNAAPSAGNEATTRAESDQ